MCTVQKLEMFKIY